MHLARFAAIGTEKGHTTDDAFPAEQFRQRLFIAQAVLQGQDLCALTHQRPHQFGIATIGKGLKPHQYQIDRPDLTRSTVSPDVRQGEIAIDGKDLQALPGDGVVITAQQKMDILAAPLQQRPVIEPQCTRSDNCNPHEWYLASLFRHVCQHGRYSITL